MDKFFRQVVDQIKTIWGRLDPVQRGIYIGGIALVFFALMLIVYFASRVEYVALYTDIAPQEAGAITAKLRDWKQPYRLVNTTILVPAKDKANLRVKLAAENLAPTRGLVGFDIFDKMRFTQTDYERRVNYLRALQGELTLTLESIEQVEEARVLLVMPQKRLFKEEEEDVTASIRLRLRPYATLEAHQIKGIINLTAAAVPGLTPENVTIVDSKGNILSDLAKEEDISTLTAHQLELQRKEGKRLESRIRRALAKVLGGTDMVEVIVKWEMDFDRVEEQEEKYSFPGFEQMKVSEERQIEKFQGEGVRPGGPPGAEAQIPAYKGLEVAKGPVTYVKDEARINYLADKKEVRKVRSPSLSKISVAVFIDGRYERDEEGRIKRDEEGNPIYIPRTPIEMAKYEEIVQAAIGYDKAREYKEREYIVKIQNVQFDRTQQWLREREEEALARRARLMGIVFGGIAILGIGAIIFGVIMAQRAKARREEERHRREMERLAALREIEEKAKEIPPEVEEEKRALEELISKPEPTAGLVRVALGEE